MWIDWPCKSLDSPAASSDDSRPQDCSAFQLITATFCAAFLHTDPFAEGRDGIGIPDMRPAGALLKQRRAFERCVASGVFRTNGMFYGFAELSIGGTFNILTKSDNSLETVDATHLLDLIALRRGSVYFRVCANTAVAYTNDSSGGDCAPCGSTGLRAASRRLLDHLMAKVHVLRVF
jgi:hypothetical protein